MSQPYFSIVVPMYNRERFIGRALRSCLGQDFEDLEVIVVDDGSSDRSIEAVREFEDQRIVLVRHERNRGQCAARNTGMGRARGQWIVFLDSDDELLPGALAAMHARAIQSTNGVRRMLFSCRSESGRVSPDPPFPDAVWDYAACMHWIEAGMGGLTEALPCVAADTFPRLHYREGRANELSYHLDCARSVLTRVSPDVVRLYHHDAPERLIRLPIEKMLQYAPDMATDADLTLESHGEAMRRWAPAFHMELQRAASTFHFLAGHRGRGFARALRVLRRTPFSARAWAVVALGLVGPRLLAFAKSRMPS
jgi:glycosyltransferase involved in cell wall biosynthesis